jgi:HB1, ASXL, restriction endonuclease HTH domain
MYPETTMSAKKKTETAKPETTEAPKAAKKKAPRTVEADAPIKARKTSALDAAAKVLGEAKKAMNTKDMIEAMAKKGYWTTPKGQTPHATLYAAISKEINTKGKESRFKKVDRGEFGLV